MRCDQQKHVTKHFGLKSPIWRAQSGRFGQFYMQQFAQNTLAQAVPVFEGYAIPHAIFKMKACCGVENHDPSGWTCPFLHVCCQLYWTRVNYVGLKTITMKKWVCMKIGYPWPTSLMNHACLIEWPFGRSPFSDSPKYCIEVIVFNQLCFGRKTTKFEFTVWQVAHLCCTHLSQSHVRRSLQTEKLRGCWTRHYPTN